MFYIRADANPQIATGHIMRCMSVADEWRKRKEEVTFITADEQAFSILESRGYRHICLHSQWNDLEQEIEPLIQCIKKYKIKELLIDSYFVTEKYLKSLRNYTKVIYFDDLGEFKYPVHMLINYNVYYKKFHYERQYDPSMTHLILGPKYAPLRSEFSKISPKSGNEVEKILITTGGGDKFNVAGELVEFLLKKGYKMKFHIVAGRFNFNKEYLNRLAEANENVILHSDVDQMWSLMSDCDLAVSAGGTTTYELCACGTPMVTYSFADNQLDVVREFDELNIAPYCGDIRKEKQNLYYNIEKNLERYIMSIEYRKSSSSSMRGLIDGTGCLRIVDAISCFFR